MTKLSLVLVTLFWLSPGTVLAADADGAFAVKGVGLTRCSDFVASVQGKDRNRIALYVGWVGGFMTASNQSNKETFDLTPWQDLRTLSSALMTICDKNADMRFVEAVTRLAIYLRKDRVVSRTERVAIPDGEKKLYVYKETVRRMQAALAERGLFTGDVNGEFDESTRTALESFQSEKKLPVNGVPDQRTLYSLFHSAGPS